MDAGNTVVAADGRVIGERALATRRRLLDSTEALLERYGVRDLKVVDITREVGSAPATFYQYFADIDAAILALAGEAAEEAKVLLTTLAPVWSEPADIDRARTFLDAYTSHWRARHGALRIANLRADEGDERFRQARVKADLVVLDRPGRHRRRRPGGSPNRRKARCLHDRRVDTGHARPADVVRDLAAHPACASAARPRHRGPAVVPDPHWPSGVTGTARSRRSMS